MFEEDEVSLAVDNDGERLDIWLSQRFSDLSRTRIKKMIESGLVLVNDQISSASYKVKKGDLVHVKAPTAVEPMELCPKELPLDILYEDQHLIVINKASGVTVHPGAGTEAETTLVEGILFYLKRTAEKGDLRPGIVHRLDKDTTGALVVSKNELAHQKLSIQFSEKTNRREYAALLGGVLPDGEVVVENYLLRDPNNRLKFIAASTDPGGSSRWSKSTFTEQARFLHRISLASVQLHTGRTHQIRVHAKTLNCPVLGDQLYGKKTDLGGHAPKELQVRLNKISRQMLHARLLGFVHPTTGESMLFEAPLPEDFREILNLLKDYLN